MWNRRSWLQSGEACLGNQLKATWALAGKVGRRSGPLGKGRRVFPGGKCLRKGNSFGRETQVSFDELNLNSVDGKEVSH